MTPDYLTMSSDLDQFDDENPYAAPRAAIGRHVDFDKEVWRDGNILVMRIQAVPPARCMKCNAPACEERWKKRLAWRPPYSVVFGTLGLGLMWTSLVVSPGARQRLLPNMPVVKVLLGSPVWTAWALILAGRLGLRSVRVSLRLCEKHERMQNLHVLERFAAGIVGFALLAAGLFSIPAQPATGFFFGLCFALAVARSINSRHFGKLIWPQRITKRYIRLRGVSPAYLNELPAFPDA